MENIVIVRNKRPAGDERCEESRRRAGDYPRTMDRNGDASITAEVIESAPTANLHIDICRKTIGSRLKYRTGKITPEPYLAAEIEHGVRLLSNPIVILLTIPEIRVAVG